MATTNVVVTTTYTQLAAAATSVAVQATEASSGTIEFAIFTAGAPNSAITGHTLNSGESATIMVAAGEQVYARSLGTSALVVVSTIAS